MLDISQNQVAWDKNAYIWDREMAEGSLFQKNLIEPMTLKFLNIQTGEKVLDLACGNGQMSRVMEKLGAEVLALDGSHEMIRLAEQRSKGHRIRYQKADLLSSDNIIHLEHKTFDAVLCNMALMDLPEIKPLIELAYKALKEKGIFVFSITHPSFDKAVGSHLIETYENDGALVHKHSIKVEHYLSSHMIPARALPVLPATHFHFHRSLQTYLNTAFEAGFSLEGFHESAFPKESPFTEHKGWHNLSDIPVALITKFRK